MNFSNNNENIRADITIADICEGFVYSELEGDLKPTVRLRLATPFMAWDGSQIMRHGIGGIETHIHIGVSVKPSLHLDEWIGKLKGGSSYAMGKGLQWQHGYGVVSFGTKDLPWILKYINNQAQHHNSGTIYDRLERIEE